MLEPAADLDRRGRHQTQLLQLAPQLVNPRNPRLVKRLQDVLLQRCDLGRELLDDDEIVVDNEVDQGIEDIVLAVGQLLGRRLGTLAAPGRRTPRRRGGPR